MTDQPNAMPHPSVSPEVLSALREMHPDPFVQAAILRLYHASPGLLEADVYITLVDAHAPRDRTPVTPPAQALAEAIERPLDAAILTGDYYWDDKGKQHQGRGE